MSLGAATPRTLAWVAMATLVLTGTSAWAQSGRTNTNTAQAVLHIQVIVMPTVLTAVPHRDGDGKLSPVAYSIPAVTAQQETTTQETALQSFDLNARSENPADNATLRTTTFVAR